MLIMLYITFIYIHTCIYMYIYNIKYYILHVKYSLIFIYLLTGSLCFLTVFILFTQIW